MTLLKTSVLGNILQIVPSYYYGALHFMGNDHAFEDAAPDRNIAGKRTLLIHVRTLLGLLGRLEVETNVFVVPHAILLCSTSQDTLATNKNTILLLVRLLGLVRLLKLKRGCHLYSVL